MTFDDIAPGAIAITVANDSAHERRREPISVGVPFAPATCGDAARLAVHDRDGRPLPLQTRVLDRWPDGSVRWLLLDLSVDCGAAVSTICSMVPDAVSDRPTGPPGVVVGERAGRVAVDTGVSRFEMAAGSRFPFVDVRTGDSAVVDCDRSGFVVENEHGVAGAASITRVVVEETGPLRACVFVQASLAPAFDETLTLEARLHFFAGSSVVKFIVTIRNLRAAQHPGGIWELGDPGSQYLRDASLIVHGCQASADAAARVSLETGTAMQHVARPIEIYQDSSGGRHWDSSNHVNRFGRVPLQFRGYRARLGGEEIAGLRATPIVAAGGSTPVAAAMRHFWQNFPKALEIDADSLIVRLFPRQFGDLHELQGGEQKTHEVFVAFGIDRVTDPPLEWCRAPLFVHLDPEQYAAAGAAPHLVPASADHNAEYLRLVSAAIEGGTAFAERREAIDEYGWRNFGDLYADHEAVRRTAPPPLISHYNNQYDGVAAFAIHFFRTADRRWWTLHEELAAHVADIDRYHTALDKSAYNGGLFWHTYHYVDAGKSSHRGYPGEPGVPGGGPSAEHDYSTGLMLHYFLTGDPRFKDAVVEMGRWVIAMDDGSRTIFRWLARGDTGLASASGSTDYHGPGRGAAYSVTTLLNAHRLSGDRGFFDKAEQLIRRCIHPRDDLDARRLLDAERRWYYTVFLQALGRYLDVKRERGELGVMYAYARESLLHYARWMAEHEFPYLHAPEVLEYPTETWAAQDMRKSEVFAIAARHAADDDERAKYLERASYFFRYSTEALAASPTASLARPLVLILGNGYMRAWFDAAGRHERVPAPEGDYDFGRPEPFVPQKTRAKQRAVALAAAGAILLAAAAAGGWAIWRCTM